MALLAPTVVRLEGLLHGTSIGREWDASIATALCGLRHDLELA